jgi:hypothetical protein
VTLGDFLHATNRPAWTLRLLVYVVAVLLVSVLVQIVAALP